MHNQIQNVHSAFSHTASLSISCGLEIILLNNTYLIAFLMVILTVFPEVGAKRATVPRASALSHVARKYRRWLCCTFWKLQL